MKHHSLYQYVPQICDYNTFKISLDYTLLSCDIATIVVLL